jgi:hypothetical protein
MAPTDTCGAISDVLYAGTPGDVFWVAAAVTPIDWVWGLKVLSTSAWGAD